VEEFCESIGFPKSDGETMFHKWQGNGWMNGGKPIKDWKATIRSWRGEGYLPSQRKLGKNGAQQKLPLSFEDRVKRKGRIMDELNAGHKSAKKDDCGRAIYSEAEKKERVELEAEMERL
jgi:hypothetical protein